MQAMARSVRNASWLVVPAPAFQAAYSASMKDGILTVQDLAGLDAKGIAAVNPDVASGAYTFSLVRTYAANPGADGSVTIQDRMVISPSAQAVTPNDAVMLTANGQAIVAPGLTLARVVKAGPVTIAGRGQVDSPESPPASPVWHVRLDAVLAAGPASLDSFRPVVGDVDGDGKTDLKDVLRILQMVVGSISPNSDQRLTADMNCDAKIDLKDAILALETAVGLIANASCG